MNSLQNLSFVLTMTVSSLSFTSESFQDNAVHRKEDLLLPYANFDEIKTQSHRFIRSCIKERHGSNAPYELQPISRHKRLQSFRFQREFPMDAFGGSTQTGNWWNNAPKTVQGHMVIAGSGLSTVSVVEPGGEGGGGGGGGRGGEGGRGGRRRRSGGGGREGSEGVEKEVRTVKVVGEGGKSEKEGEEEKLTRKDEIKEKTIDENAMANFDAETREIREASDAERVSRKRQTGSDSKPSYARATPTPTPTPPGCGSRARVPVRETASAADCRFAVNAGFFDTRTGACHGHVVVDGKVAQTGSEMAQNAHFGITKDGHVFVGYLSIDTPLDWEQLVGGVIWLVRRGKSFVEESRRFECEQTQETGSLRRFADVISARTAIGHNPEGEIVLIQVDGKTDKKGLNLHEFAELLISLGVVNAINLDGGGSATFVENKTTTNFPSDTCSLPGSTPAIPWSCDRPVSTIICIHDERCPQNCSGRGICAGRGSSQKCLCSEGWRGRSCELKCPPGKYGRNCASECECQKGGTRTECDGRDGECKCRPGFTGSRCEAECPFGWFGAECSLPCSCGDDCPCHHVTGSCFWQPKSPNQNQGKISRVAQDMLQNSSNLSVSLRALDLAANCKARMLINSLELVSEEPSQYFLFLTTLSSVSVLCAISIIVNFGLLCWRCRRKSSQIRYAKLKMEVDSSRPFEASGLNSVSQFEDEMETKNEWTDSSEASGI